MASYCDETVVIWDTRNFDKPILTKPQSADVVQLAWSPTRSGLLCSLTKGSTDTLTLHDIQSWAVMTEVNFFFSCLKNKNKGKLIYDRKFTTVHNSAIYQLTNFVNFQIYQLWQLLSFGHFHFLQLSILTIFNLVHKNLLTFSKKYWKQAKSS